MGKDKIDQTLKIFVRRLRTEFNPENILLFGSYASGTANEYSDIDILVIASSFKRLSFDERLSKLHRLAIDLDPDVNAFGFTPDEVKKNAYITTLRDALKTGRRIEY
ncbi:hypothetical protein A3C23_02440 [Candidatus Roizmanbacteria bacterium RIFCSPHIGHO2_02_FULL_37_13b]|uniref:Polymerase nucleotidyl transferase domain-containing protein n=1 Tax=Candidatus Roizmanbacteria bacterium RIFCSPLOWO2_02_FULL_36_11 TaxID=1802071 RepID=A0A1F7JIR2_9BACT|nr:MAG: hypothetical protein A3C23_02440 [Candidatus Roizmanbacteria bacterium RIFCSPHIGHO2_02_FULL_37_13b]OGK55493.1 MAG: hypothetical protein A3H78_04985 [Candidatus Roizmanbacteria bacterium RIFCSPLOWO2_02_FULL_36_11]